MTEILTYLVNFTENKLAKDVEEKEKDESEDKNKEDVFIQDIGFSVKIVAPGAEPFDIQVNLQSNKMFRS